MRIFRVVSPFSIGDRVYAGGKTIYTEDHPLLVTHGGCFEEVFPVGAEDDVASRVLAEQDPGDGALPFDADGFPNRDRDGEDAAEAAEREADAAAVEAENNQGADDDEVVEQMTAEPGARRPRGKPRHA